MAERAEPGAVVAEVPDGADPAVAAALGIAGLAGWMPFAWRAPVREDDRVLVLGATGTVGEVAVQVARLLGAASVVAAGRDPKRLERALELGADEAVPLDGDFGEPTYVFDPLCGEPLERAVAAAAPGARIVQLGQAAGPTATLPSAAIRGKQLELYGFSDFAVARGRACRALPAARRARARRRDRGRRRASRARRDRRGLGPSGQAGRLLLRTALGFPPTPRGGSDDRARDPAHRAARRTDADQPLDRRQDRRRDVRPDEPGLQPRARGAGGRGRPRDGRGGRRRGRGREGGVPRLARHLAREARGADVPRSASSCTSAARRSRGSSPPSTARSSPTRWARSRAGSR